MACRVFYSGSIVPVYSLFSSDRGGNQWPGDAPLGFALWQTKLSPSDYGITLWGKAGWGENMAFVDILDQRIRRHLVRQEIAPNPCYT